MNLEALSVASIVARWLKAKATKIRISEILFTVILTRVNRVEEYNKDYNVGNNISE